MRRPYPKNTVTDSRGWPGTRKTGIRAVLPRYFNSMMSPSWRPRSCGELRADPRGRVPRDLGQRLRKLLQPAVVGEAAVPHRRDPAGRSARVRPAAAGGRPGAAARPGRAERGRHGSRGAVAGAALGAAGGAPAAGAAPRRRRCGAGAARAATNGVAGPPSAIAVPAMKPSCSARRQNVSAFLKGWPSAPRIVQRAAAERSRPVVLHDRVAARDRAAT